MSSYRSRRVIPSSLNTPTTIRVNKSQNITGSDAERLITDFINASDANANGIESKDYAGLSRSSDVSAILSQLKRIQRNLRGLPPITAEATIPSTSQNTSEPPNKKIKFSEDEEEEVAVEEEAASTRIESGNEEEEVDEDEEDIEKSKKKDKKHKKEKNEKKKKSKD
ncbi:uncharacterized protein J8A68_002981 [[Candida] subhashii]|uniref:Uncharacterized protein n=1 Tax=[Candida] subhashii TaxID=561895 RepID=A0A8J5QI99_9ASCO|nr:uncharacterized protein J8A68_002981 [[Candida] subhashii]KAG7663522.1 hypothetical protein J8A68_002981 [[Candida] subhashii]